MFKELKLLISVCSLSTTYKKEKKEKVTMIYKTLLGVSYLKTRNSTYNKLLTRTYLQTLFSINDQQLLIFLKRKILFNRILKIVIQMYRCTTHAKENKEKKPKKKYYKIKSTGDQLNIAYDEVNFLLGI